jgi:acyl-CoA synthetase (AMP-forming)/AMP-acid ligase II
MNAHTYEGVPNTSTLVPRRTILESLAHQVAVRGDAPFLTTLDAGEPVTMTYAELDHRSRGMAARLRSSGLSPGSVVAFAPANDALSVVTVFALLRTGCRTLLVNPTDPDARVREQAAGARASVVLRSPSATFTEGVEVPGETPAPAAGPDHLPDPLDDALYFGTSGSTAASKLVAQSYYNAAVNAEALARHHRLRPGDVLLGCLPIHHVNGLHFTVFGVLAAGAHVVLAAGFDPFRYPRLLTTFRPRIASAVPSILEALHETWRSPDPPAGLDYFVSAAAPLTAGTARAVLDTVGVPVLQGYGLTETTNFSTTLPAGLPDAVYRELMLDVEIPSVGVAVWGNEVAVLDPSGNRCAPGEVGEICMRGHNVMNGYLHNPSATAAAFAHGWFHSQDLGYTVARAGHEYFVITGRSKNIAKVGGAAVSLDELDRFLRALPDVRDAACVAVPHRFLGEEIIAAVVYRDGPVDLRPQLRTAFAEAVLPARFVSLPAIPRTHTGKVLRPQLEAALT